MQAMNASLLELSSANAELDAANKEMRALLDEQTAAMQRTANHTMQLEVDLAATGFELRDTEEKAQVGRALTACIIMHHGTVTSNPPTLAQVTQGENEILKKVVGASGKSFPESWASFWSDSAAFYSETTVTKMEISCYAAAMSMLIFGFFSKKPSKI